MIKKKDVFVWQCGQRKSGTVLSFVNCASAWKPNIQSAINSVSIFSCKPMELFNHHVALMVIRGLFSPLVPLPACENQLIWLTIWDKRPDESLVSSSLQVYEVPLPVWMWKAGTELPRRASGSYRQQPAGRPPAELRLGHLQLLPRGPPLHAVLTKDAHVPRVHAHSQQWPYLTCACDQER